ncbi:hypothetical protein DFH29DRAFT_1005431 [Suillus ampliporus]|nr:hypothetical protein DFH29DRAFT_1005431 [Suillus ampliporus]
MAQAPYYNVRVEFGEDWTAADLEVLFARLSAPFELIMAIDFESNWKEQRVKDLVDNCTSPLKFIFGKDEETDKRWPFEHEVIWDVVLGVISELKLQHHIKNLDNLFCTAAAAVYCALWELRSGKMVNVVFSAFSYKDMYGQLMDYIIKYITPNTELAKRWKDFKACTVTRLEDILIY